MPAARILLIFIGPFPFCFSLLQLVVLVRTRLYYAVASSRRPMLANAINRPPRASARAPTMASCSASTPVKARLGPPTPWAFGPWDDAGVGVLALAGPHPPEAVD